MTRELQSNLSTSSHQWKRVVVAAPLLLSGTHGAIFAAEVMHHHAVGVPGKRTERESGTRTLWCWQMRHFEFWASQISLLPVSYFLFADSAGLLVCNDTFDLLVENSLLLHLKIRLKVLILQQAPLKRCTASVKSFLSARATEMSEIPGGPAELTLRNSACSRLFTTWLQRFLWAFSSRTLSRKTWISLIWTFAGSRLMAWETQVTLWYSNTHF